MTFSEISIVKRDFSINFYKTKGEIAIFKEVYYMLLVV
jgi:hypothetical protein